MDVICQLAVMCYKDCAHKFKHPFRGGRCACLKPNVAAYVAQKPRIKDQWAVDYLEASISRAYCIDYELWQDVMKPGVDFVSDGRVIHEYHNFFGAEAHPDAEPAGQSTFDIGLSEMTRRINRYLPSNEEEEREQGLSFDEDLDEEWEEWMERQQDEEIQEEGRIHDSITWRSTGRVRSDAPNMQNMPRPPRPIDGPEDDHEPEF